MDGVEDRLGFAGDDLRDPAPCVEGERDRFESGALGPTLGDMEFGLIGRLIGVPNGSEIARVLPLPSDDVH